MRGRPRAGRDAVNSISGLLDFLPYLGMALGLIGLYLVTYTCIAGRVRPADACIAAYRAALDSDAAGAPRYPTQADCERHHGPDGCRPAADLGPGRPAGAFVPLLAAYMIGRRAAQAMPPHPLYRHRPDEEEGRGGGSGR